MDIENSALTYRAIIYHPKQDEKHIKKLIDKGAQVFDQLNEQLVELIKIKHPNEPFDLIKANKRIKELTSSPFYYGVWVYYPWNNQLIHLLPENEFIRVRTSRNKYKITQAEQEQLSQKKIGIIGLSVGHSVALTLAMERAFGELRLCDFDILELSNYNRIRTKLSHLGLKKTVSVAREIAEIDPFLKVRCFHEGLNLNNLDTFFTANGHLDLCIDECDSIDIKIHCRIKAKELNIPVIMEASDKCTLDVERFDLEPDRPLLHGYLKGLDTTNVDTLQTAEEKLPFMLAFMPPHSLSTKMVASMIELGHTISTWPQLASSVSYGGGICASIARQMLLGEHKVSGRWQLDIGDYFSTKKPCEVHPEIKENTDKNLLDYKAIVTNFPKKKGVEQLKKSVEKIVADACMAPSGGNMQPWHFHFDEDRGLFLFLDKSHVSLTIDYQYVSSIIALGAAAENILLSAEHHDIPFEFNLLDHFLEDLPVAHFFPATRKKHPFPKLYHQIQSRQTNRMLGNRIAIPPSMLHDFSEKAKAFEGLEIRWIEQEQFGQFAAIYAQIERIRLLDKQCHKELMQELRWSRAEEVSKKNGISIDSLDLTALERTSLQFLKRDDALSLINAWDLGKGLLKLFKKSINTASALGVICGSSNSYDNFFKTGMLLERVWLSTTAHHLAFQPVSPVTLLHSAQEKGAHQFLATKTNTIIAKEYQALATLLKLPRPLAPFFVFKLAKTAKQSPQSIRKEIPISYSK